jgi:hypothetical protein
MTTLIERLAEVMAAKSWEHADLVRVSGESSSVVSQWLGKGSKVIKSIGKMETAMRIEDASGYAALWLAKGIGPKMKTRVAHDASHRPFDHPLLTRELMMKMGELPARFTFVLDDDAMGEHGRAGTEVLFHAAGAAKVGAGVLVHDKNKALHVRRKAQGRSDTHWIAVAPNRMFRDLDSEADGLTILAVWRGVVNKGLEDL